LECVKGGLYQTFLLCYKGCTVQCEREEEVSWPALFAVIFWGFSFVATKVALKEVHPFALLALRFGVGACLLLLVQCYRDRKFLRAFSLKDWASIILLAIVGIAGHNLLQAYGLLYTTAINTGWIIAVQPIFITLSARLFLRERITWKRIGGIILGFSGVFLIISKGLFSLSLFRIGSTFGDFLVLCSALTWAAFTVGGRGFLSRFPPLAAITPIMMTGCLITFFVSSLRGGWGFLFHLSLSTWMGVLFLGILCSGLGYFFWYSALGKKDSSLIGMYLFLEPFVTLIGAILFLGERVFGITLVGGGLTLLGVYLATRTGSNKAVKRGNPSVSGAIRSG